jgi:hypothetical protein
VKILVPLFLLFITPIWSSADTQINRDFTDQVSQILKEYAEIKPGMTHREQLLKYFGTEGGVSAPSYRTYVSKHCPYVKVDVRFSLSKPNQGLQEMPTDVIQSISKPYLEYSICE